MSEDDRRTFQRLKLPKPMQAVVDGRHALILDVGVEGVLVEHFGRFAPGDRFRLVFRWHSLDIEYTCEALRSRVTHHAVGVQPEMSQTGARFVQAWGESEERLREMIATFIGRILAAQKTNAAATDVRSAEMLAAIGGARRLRANGWITCRLIGGAWRCSYTITPRQPADGFTVGGFEDEEEIETLCQTWAIADEEGRRLIRMVAELSAAAVPAQTS